MVVRRERHDRHPFVDERDRAVLHLAGGVAFRVDVRNLLQLERALESDRIVDSPTQVEKVRPRLEPRGNFLDLGRQLERLFEQLRNLEQGVDVGLRRFRRERALGLRQAEAEQVERDEL